MVVKTHSLIRIDVNAGHGAGMPVSMVIGPSRRRVLVYLIQHGL